MLEGMCRVLFLMLLLHSLPAAASSPLADSPSPYLALHADDPVAWQPWHESLLEQARQEEKLLFISSGYFACHWCHVMQRESFRDEAIAAWLNTHFIPVKIDRELRPELDSYLNDFVARTRGSAGWPLSVFITPEGHPLAGTTYLPPQHDGLVAHMLRLLPQLAREQGLDDGFRTIINTGKGGGQEVFHLHIHLLGGSDLPGF